MNIAFVRGRLSSAPRQSEMKSGDLLVRYEVTVDHDDAPSETVPVAWIGAPSSQPADHEIGAEVVVLGRVRRRYWRGETATRSSTEVVAEAVVDAGDRRRVRALAKRAATALGDA